MTQTRVERYVHLMNLAAKGDYLAAQLLLDGGWFPGLPTDRGQQDRLIDYARSIGYGEFIPNSD